MPCTDVALNVNKLLRNTKNLRISNGLRYLNFIYAFKRWGKAFRGILFCVYVNMFYYECVTSNLHKLQAWVERGI